MPFNPFEKAIPALKAHVDAACDPTAINHVPGAVTVVVDRSGREVFAYAGGKRGVGVEKRMSVDSVFWIASCTKLVTAIACWQLVERGHLSLDDTSLVDKHIPELRDVKVMVREGNKLRLEEKKSEVTLRMLLSHTAGFGYSFFHEGVRDYGRPIGFDEVSGDIKDMLQPLVAHPGKRWTYGINLDWPGILVERITNQSLGSYFQEHIFEPLGITDIPFTPNESMKQRLAYMNSRDSNGKLSLRDHICRRGLQAETPEEIQACFNSGGGGLFAKSGEYCKILSTLLNNGVSPHTNNRILQRKTVDELFTHQIPQFPNFGRQGLADAKPDLTHRIND